ncbi:MAG: ParB N-terminal domain-containing protein [Hyphomicrobiaceae bacterium]
MTMLHHIPLADLKVSRLNVRKHGPKDIASLAASIAANGVLQPLVVRATDEGYEIIAGQRRFLAAKSLDTTDPETPDTVPCIVLDRCDDAAAVEASLAENIERLPMDEMDQHEAFMALRRKGLECADIAAHFGITEQVVKRRLALANLIPDIRRLYRQGEIDGKTLHILTLASKERQRAWVQLVTDPDATPPPFWQLKAWLLGGSEIATRAALFDEADYTGAITTDLFGEDRFFTDADEFWRLQNAAIVALQEKFGASGWKDVRVVPPSERFEAWDHEPATKAQGGNVVIDVEPDGTVTVHKGIKRRGSKPRNDRSTASEGETEDSEPTVIARPELSAPLANLVDLVRHSAVRLAVADAPKVALRLALAHMIGGSRLWSVEAEPQTPINEAIAACRETLPSRQDFDAKRTEALNALRLDGETLVARDTSGTRTATAFARLIELSDKDVLRLLAVVMAEALSTGTTLVDSLGTLLTVDVAAAWQPDDVFFDLVRDREVVSAMLSEVIGETATRSYLTDTSTKKKTLIRKALAGDGRTKVEAWTPRYFRFPRARYTERPLTARGTSAA